MLLYFETLSCTPLPDSRPIIKETKGTERNGNDGHAAKKARTEEIPLNQARERENNLNSAVERSSRGPVEVQGDRHPKTDLSRDETEGSGADSGALAQILLQISSSDEQHRKVSSMTASSPHAPSVQCVEKCRTYPARDDVETLQYRMFTITYQNMDTHAYHSRRIPLPPILRVCDC